ncbi:filamentous hemagglutinin N-terminal domain-containing protein [Prochlorothrix hollandica]|uniref:Filamentous haemagglutinin FhaB/tRNA nuclease CdiA-like TPS domain-containing protein n=1 Tax=Prochlorothrix hollandica PCC 9006 = CALU 1027 TaxID=317619 RepID=A0A0M2PTT8_PROHO|nr:filamentous hemagglutinin N-terminal domain-containing protein [Prochlorothrix hollandica]KKI98088.1 hypothetical protein PROH_20405 [Prochlorothrix hollandica PCC 9006 = CALU 1027]
MSNTRPPHPDELGHCLGSHDLDLEGQRSPATPLLALGQGFLGRSARRSLSRTSLVLGLSLWVTGTSQAQAQPITAAPDGTGTQVQQQGEQFNISGGTQAGANQFHSFEKFGLESQQTANFQTDPGTANVLGRVTGGDASVINGTVQVTGSEANLYLMNPAGMVFGKDARLDVPGSFHGTTGDSIGIGGGEFSATGSNSYQNLAGAPNRFNFEGGSTGAIVNQGDLAVNQGKNLSLTGSTVINTGTLTAPGGQVATVSAPTGQGSQSVRISQEGMVMGLEVDGDRLHQQHLTTGDLTQNPTNLPKVLTGGTVDHATDLRVENGRVYLRGSGMVIDPLTGSTVVTGSVTVSSPTGSGQILIQGDRVQVLDARLAAQTDRPGPGGQIQIQAQNQASLVSSQVNLANLVGIGGLLGIKAPTLTVQNSAIAATGTQAGGSVHLDATQGASQLWASVVTVTSAQGLGGRVEVLGDRVELQGATIDASGVAGGQIYVGGDYQGTGTLATAQETIVDAQSVLKAEGLGWTPTGSPVPPSDLPNALGGTVIVWSDDKTRFHGVLRAKGAAEFSDSGFAEVSGKQFLDLGEYWDQRISVGELLLDPSDITIVAGTVGVIASSPTGVTSLRATKIANFLNNNGDLTITTSGGTGGSGNIILNGGVAIAWTSVNGLTLQADRSIILSTGSSITSTSGDITLEANLAGTATASSDGISLTGASINTTSGAITLTGQGGSGCANGKVGIILSNSQINSVSGDITLTGTGGSNAATDSNAGIGLTQGSFITSTGTGADAAKITLVGVGGAGTNFNHGVVLRNVNGVATPDVGIRSAEGAISLRGTGSGSGTGSMGIQLDGSITATGTGSVSLTGIGGRGTTDLSGILLAGTVQSAIGAILLNGTGGRGTGANNPGVEIKGGQIQSTGTAPITIKGMGGTGLDNQRGVFLDTRALVTSASGAITVDGKGGTGGSANTGVVVRGSAITSTGTGATAAPITIIATGGGGSTPPPALSILKGAAVTAVDGAIDLTGTRNRNGTNPINRGIVITGSTVATTGTGTLRLQVPTATRSDAIALLSNASLGSATGSGTITLIAPTLALDSANIRGMGLLTLTPLDPASSIGLGDNVTGNFKLTALELNNIAPTFSSIDIGVVGGTTGSVRVGLGIDARVAALVNLLGGSDLGAGDNDGNQWVLTGSNSGTINGIRFQGFTSLLGGSLGDSLQGTIGNDSFQLTGADQITVGSMTFTSVETIAGDAGDDEFVLAGGTLTGAIAGGTGSNTLAAGNLATNFVVTGTDSGTATGITGGFTSIQNLTGGTANDSFTLNGGTLSGAIDGGAGIDSLTTPNQATTFGITGTNSGTLTGVANGFQNLENLTGNAQGDIFQFTAAGSIQGTIDGAGGSDLLIADDSGAFIDISGTDGGTYGGKVAGWQNIENIQGGAGDDTFLLSATTLTGTLDGGGGNDLMVGDTVANQFIVLVPNGGTVTGVLGGFSNIENLTGNSQTDTFLIASTGSLAGLIDGAGGFDTLISDDSGVTFVITGADAGVLRDRIQGFARVETLTGGLGNDVFILANGSLQGLLDGGAGMDQLFGGYTDNANLESIVPGVDGVLFASLLDLSANPFAVPVVTPGEVAINEAAISTGNLSAQSLTVASMPEDPVLASPETSDPVGQGSTVPTATSANSDGTNATPPAGSNGTASPNVPDPTTAQGSQAGAAASAGAGSATGAGAGTPGSGSGMATASNSGGNGGSAGSAASGPDPTTANGSDGEAKVPDPTAANGSDGKAKVPDPTAASGSDGSGADAAPDPNAVASASGLGGDTAAGEGSGSGSGLAIAAALAGLAALGGAAAAVATGTAASAAQATRTAAQNLISSLQNLAGASGAGGAGGAGAAGSPGFPLAAAAAAVTASQAQQQLAQMGVALEPEFEPHFDLSINKEGGASLTEGALALGEKEAWDAAGEPDDPSELPALAEVFGLGEAEVEDEEDSAAAEAADQDAGGLGAIVADNTAEAPKVNPDAIAAVKAKIEEAAAAAGIPDGAVDAIYAVAIEKIGEILSEVDIASGILGTAWSKSFELMEYRDLLAHIQSDGSVMIPLVNHEVLAEQAPSIHLKFQETPVGTFEVNISLGLVINGALVAIEAGKITEIRLGTFSLAGGIEFSGIPFLEVPEMDLEVNKVLRLGNGIQIKLGSATV